MRSPRCSPRAATSATRMATGCRRAGPCSPGRADADPAQELATARRHFFVPRRYRDPMHPDDPAADRVVILDPYDLLVTVVVDALGNATTVGERALAPRAATGPQRLRLPGAAAGADDGAEPQPVRRGLRHPRPRGRHGGAGGARGRPAAGRLPRRGRPRPRPGRRPALAGGGPGRPGAAARRRQRADPLRPRRLPTDRRGPATPAGCRLHGGPGNARRRPGARATVPAAAELGLLRRLRPRAAGQEARGVGHTRRPALEHHGLGRLQQQGQTGPPVRAVLQRPARLRAQRPRRSQHGPRVRPGGAHHRHAAPRRLVGEAGGRRVVGGRLGRLRHPGCRPAERPRRRRLRRPDHRGRPAGLVQAAGRRAAGGSRAGRGDPGPPGRGDRRWSRTPMRWAARCSAWPPTGATGWTA